MIEIILSMENIDDINLINTYFNALINDERITKFQLKKFVDGWFKINS